MLIRNCSGGIVFYNEKVFIIKNDKEEWVLPKGVIRSNELSFEVALERVFKEGGIKAEIVSTAGETSYEFYSYSRKKPVCNQITWYIMESDNENFEINKEEGFTGGGYFPIHEAIDKITYSQDKALVRLSYEKYRDLRKVVYA